MALCFVSGVGHAATIVVNPGDSYDKIEAAQAGDEVLIAPGTYQFRVNLSNDGTPSSKIVIRAQDPDNRPVWDLSGQATSSWPGSYGGGDNGRGCWQVRGDHYEISGIIWRGCQDRGGAGLRAVNTLDLTVRDCEVHDSTNGITGTADPYVIEHTLFTDNGKVFNPGDNPAHSLYVFGGRLVLRYNLFLDTVEGQSFHVRAREAIIEYNWIQNPGSYLGDLMSCERFCGGTGSNPVTQSMVLRGNVLIQGNPANGSQIIALFNDSPGGSNDDSGAVGTMDLTLEHNTVIGNGGSSTSRLVNMRNDGVGTNVTLDNNVIYQVDDVAESRDPGASNWSIAGTNNWLSTGTEASELSMSTTGSDPGFRGASSEDYVPAMGSPLVGAASGAGRVDREYFENTTNGLQYRARSSSADVGAFEHDTSGPGVGPYDPPPMGTGGAGGGAGMPGTGGGGAMTGAGGASNGGSSSGGASSGGTSNGGASTGGSSGGGGPSGGAVGSGATSAAGSGAVGAAADSGDDGGCGCRLEPRQGTVVSPWIWVAALVFWRIRRRRSSTQL